MVVVFRVVKHSYTQFIYIFKPLDYFHAIMRIDCETHFSLAFFNIALAKITSTKSEPLVFKAVFFASTHV